ncbi:hypothetical protein SAY86_016646 [Trapa natans]|uniref:J domain-containing protein n=1 Tax=Trapa natans TaxID=22666 RepID=A0AAN7LDL8_TRANT|nr:hypothetical protein SAY86_016646 [Trapa natans]
MRSYGLILPGGGGTDPSRFRTSPRYPAATRPDYPIWVRFGQIRASASSGTEELQASAAATAASFYELLGIAETGTLPEIKQAYKQLARKYHPDVSPPDRVEEFTQRFIRVQEAYETLSDPRRRALYDRDMAKGLHLALTARKLHKFDEGIEGKSEWKSRWQSQLSELKRRSSHKSSRENMSWGARMRRQRDECSYES